MSAARSIPACPRCAATVGPWGAAPEGCGICRGRSLRIGGTTRIGVYADEFGTVIRMFKYKGQERFLPLLGAFLDTAIRSASWFHRVEAVVPVPTHWRHRLDRPFHAAEVLASAVAPMLKLPCLPLLRRVRGGPHQIGLSFTQRKTNVRGAFALAKRARIERARVLLIDDVRTTGATLEECARVLKRAGCSEVYAAIAAAAGSAISTQQPINV